MSNLFANPIYRHPQYSNLAKRLESLTNWPMKDIVSPESLAENGFFYTGMRDLVRCCFCGLGLHSWEPGDDPFVEHGKYSSSVCFFHEQLAKNRAPKPEKPTEDIRDVLAVKSCLENGYELKIILAILKDETIDSKNISAMKLAELCEKYGNSQTTLENTKERGEDVILCKICFDKRVTRMFNPCGHVACCEDCDEKIQRCPLCRAVITGRKNVYF